MRARDGLAGVARECSPVLASSEPWSSQAVGTFGGGRYASEDAVRSQIGRCRMHGEISVITATANSRAEAGLVTRR